MLSSNIKTLEIDLISVGRFNDLFYGIKAKNELNYKLLFSFFQKFKKNLKIESVIFRGSGEPLNHPSFFAIAQYFIKQNITIDIFTFPDLVGEYLKLFGYGNSRVTYTVYNYPCKNYKKDLQELRKKILYRFNKKSSLLNFKHFYLLDRKSYPKFNSFIGEVRKWGEPFTMIKIINNRNNLTMEETESIIKKFADLNIGKNIHWEDGRNFQNRCSYLRGERMFIDSKNEIAFCHFLPQIKNSEIVDLTKIKSLKEVADYYRFYEETKSKDNEKKDYCSSLKMPAPCDYCYRFLLRN